MALTRGASKVLLVSAPWRLANWPSLAIGVLKAHLARLGFVADGLHLHFLVAHKLGMSRYAKIANGWELGEALYFSLYSPEEAEKLLSQTTKKLIQNDQPELAQWSNYEMMIEVEKATIEVIDSVPLSQYRVIGISVGALQLGASLYLAKIFKQRAPHLRVVLGGGNVLGEPGAKLLHLVPWIDVIVDGEGEHALAELVATEDWGEISLGSIPNLHYRKKDGSIVRSMTRVMASLNDSFPPDMDEFYSAARVFGYPRSDLVMPIEASRGCAWEHRGEKPGQLSGCTFCGLYRNSPNFREKKIEKVMEELRQGVAKTQALEISFVDAYLPPSYAKKLLKAIAEAELDATLFCEMRCDLDEEIVHLLARAGARQVQLGVESFHTRILAKMAKGVRMIDNVYSIKLCEEYGIHYQYNLIAHFPGICAEELNEMKDLLPLLYGFRPPSFADFYLDRSSRIYADPARYGIPPENLECDTFPFLPSSLAVSGISQVVTYDDVETEDVRLAWTDINSSVETWRTRHELARSQGIANSLSFRDTGESLLINDYRNDEPLFIELGGTGRDVLLASERLLRKSDLQARLPEIDPEQLDNILDSLRQHRLIIKEGAWLLGLPVRMRLPNGTPRRWS